MKHNLSKRILALLLTLAMVLSLIPMAVAAPAEDLTGKTVILHTNDTHGALLGFAQVAQVKADLEAKGATVLLVDAGDYSQGTTYVSTSKGETAVTMLNAAGYDFATLGNHEFDFGYAQLVANMEKATFKPIVADVLLKETGESIYDGHAIKEVNGVKIGFFGMETPETFTKVNPGLIQEITFPQGEEMYACAQAEVDALKEEGADLIIGLVHLGVDPESEPNRSIDLYEHVTGIDFLIDGHSHTVMTEGPNGEPIQSTGTKESETALMNVGYIQIDNETKKIEKNELIPLGADAPVDETVAAVAREIMDAVDAEYGAVFATSEVELNGDRAPGNRNEETNLGDLITDSMRWGVLKDMDAETLGVPEENVVAITNGGGIRAWIHAGEVTKNDINTVLPFGNTVAVVYVTGAELLEALEASTYCTPTAVGGFPQVAGMKINIDVTKPFVQGAQYPASTYYGPSLISRVAIDEVGGKAFDPEATYAVVTNNFCAAGGDTYYVFKNASAQFDTGIPLDEMLISYINEELGGTISQEDYAETQGRITQEERPAALAGKTVILHTNDTHGALLGFAQVAKVKADYETVGANVILVDAGDFSQGTTYVSTNKGAAAVTMLNAAGYDVVTLGNHEFDFGFEQLMQNLEDAEFTTLCADVFYKGTDNTILPTSIAIAGNGLKIGFFGMETPETQTKVNPGLITEIEFGTNENGKFLSSAQNAIAELKDCGADIIIGVVHLGVDDESEPYRSVDLYDEVKDDVDFLIDGHSHTVMTEGPNGEPIQSTGTKESETALMNVGYIQIDNETKKIEKNELIPLGADAPVDETVAAVAREIMDAVDAEYGAVFATSEVELNGDRAPGNRNEETNLGDLITDSMRWGVLKDMDAETLGVPEENVVAITNGGGIRAWIHAGDVTKNDVNTVLPFGNTVAVVYVTGAELLEALEASTYCTPTAVGGFPQVSGLKFNIDVNREFAEGDLYPASTYHAPASIKRVDIENVNGKKFNPNATYAVVTNNFCAAGGDTYYVFKNASSQFDTGIPLDEMLINYIDAELNGVIGAEYAEPQGRITEDFRFDDVRDASKFYFEPVYWAVNHDPQITTGTSDTTFSPTKNCTRGQVVTFLWRAMGKPEAANKEHNFVDVKEGAYYYDAMLWAVENEITTGTSATTFGPNKTATRGQVVTFLWRAMGKPEAANKEHNFADVKEGAYYYDAMLWAVEAGVTNGTSATKFSPNNTCNRGQVVTFLMRAVQQETPATGINFPSTSNDDIAKYGNIYTNITGTDFFALGYTWGDVVTVKFLDQELDLPIVPTFSYVDQGTPGVFVNKDGETGEPTGRMFMAINMGDFASTYGLATKTTNPDKSYFWTAVEGVKFPVPVEVSMKEQGGYMDEMLLRDINRTNNREDYPELTDAEFANFRQITTTGMGDHLFRGSSPINPEIGRNTYADAELEKAGVTVIMNLANDQATAEAYEGYAETYYSKQNVVFLNLGVDFQADDFKAGLAVGLKHFASNPGVYYVHCTEGKDRAGFVSALLECFMGATYEEVVADYLKTYTNYYTVVDGVQQPLSEETLNAIAESNIIKTLKAAFGVEDLTAADLAAEAEEYIASLGLTEEEIANLRTNLGGTAEPEPAYFLVGDVNGWAPAEGYQLTASEENEGEWVLTVELPGKLNVKIFDQTNNLWYPDGMNNDCWIEDAGTYDVSFYPEGGKNGYHYGYFKLTKQGEPQTEPAYYLVGDVNNWAPAEGYQLTASEENEGEWVLTVELPGKLNVKIFDQTNNLWYPDGMNNDCWIEDAGTYDVSFYPEGGKEGYHEGYFKLTKQEENPKVETTFPSATKADMDKYGDVHFSITSADLAAAGFEYADLVKLSFLDQELIVPVIPQYRYVGAKAVGLVMWEDGTKPAEVEVFNGSFAATYGLADIVRDGNEYTVTPREGVEFPVPVTIEMYEKQGYADTYAIFDLTRSDNREDYRGNTEPYPELNDEEFANFRVVDTTGMGEGTLYRSSSPINPSIKRNTYADQAAEAAGIKSFVNLADSAASAAKYAGYAETYYSDQEILFLNLGVDFTTELNRTGLVEAMNFLQSCPTPVLVHCNEGQDRAGFVSALLECLMGASYDEVVDDYMVTFYNYYGVQKGTDQYNQISNNIVKNLSTAFGLEMSQLASADLAAEAEEYFLELGVSEETIAAVKVNLGGNAESGNKFEIVQTSSNSTRFGHLDMNVSVAEFLELYELGDVVTVEVNGFTFDAPVVTNYDDVDTGAYLLRCANGKTVVTLAINYGQIGVVSGMLEPVEGGYAFKDGIEWPVYATVTLKEAGGYADELSIRKLNRTNVRSDYDDLSDEEFANFRVVGTTGMGSNALYRSSSPIDPDLGRNTYADAAAEAAGVRTFINLADTQADAEAFAGYTDSYYSTQTKIFLGLPVAFTSDEFKAGLANGFRFITTNDGPYLIHCLEGKDRTGLSVGVLECLMGASLDEIQADYLKTYENYFEVQNNEHIALTEAQVTYLKGIITKNLGIIFDADLETADLVAEAEAYLTEIGLTADEIAALKVNLGKTWESTEPQPETAYYLVGDVNGWAPAEGYQLAASEENEGEWILTVALPGKLNVKIYDQTNDLWYPDGMNNDCWIEDAGTYDVSFYPEGGKDGYHYGYFKLTKREETPAASYFQKVTDASTLQAGDQIIFVSEAQNVACAAMGTGKFFTTAQTTVEDGKLYAEDAILITLGGGEGAWTLTTSEGLIGSNAAKALNHNGDGTTTWTIAIDENGDATVTVGTFGRILYNVNSPRFLNYTSNTNASMLLPQLYKLVTG